MNKDFIAVGQRLRELREGYADKNVKSGALTNERLSELIQIEYCVKISPNTLRNYEKQELQEGVIAQGNTCHGMSAENLCALADFYGVSTDYLLCRSDIKTPDVEDAAICNKLNLTEDSLDTLRAVGLLYSDGLNFLLSYDCEVDEIFSSIAKAIENSRPVDNFNMSVDVSDLKKIENMIDRRGLIILTRDDAVELYLHIAERQFAALLDAMFFGGDSDAE